MDEWSVVEEELAILEQVSDVSNFAKTANARMTSPVMVFTDLFVPSVSIFRGLDAFA